MLSLFQSIPGKDSTHGLHSAETILTANFTHLSPERFQQCNQSSRASPSMNLPLAWATALPASLVAKQSVEQTLNSASHFFGDVIRSTLASPSHLKEHTPSDNGLSGPHTPAPNLKASPSDQDWSSRFTALKKQLGKIVEDARVRWGLPPTANKGQEVQVSIDRAGNINVAGPEPVRTEINSTVLSNASLVQELQQVASARPDSQGQSLHLNSFPNSNPADTDPFRIWID